MLEPHRRVHFRLWILLAAILPLLLIATFVMRPRHGEGGAAQRIGGSGIGLSAPLPRGLA